MREVTVGKHVYKLDHTLLQFGEENINQFLERYAGMYDHYSHAHAYAQSISDSAKAKYEGLLDEKFVMFKEQGGSDKLCEAKAGSDPLVQLAQQEMINAQFVSRDLYGWLRSMDKAHESAKEFCYNLRKEIDKIGGGHVRQLDALFREANS